MGFFKDFKDDFSQAVNELMPGEDNLEDGAAAMLAYRSSGMKQKAGTVKMQDFSKMVQNTSAQATSQTDKTAATKEVSEVDEMAAFKQEIYEELAEIDKMNSSAILSNSVHITEDGFKRMKEDPAYRKEIMDWLREVRSAHIITGLPDVAVADRIGGVKIQMIIVKHILDAGRFAVTDWNKFAEGTAAVDAGKIRIADFPEFF